MGVSCGAQASFGGLAVKFKLRINPLAIIDVKEIKDFITEDSPEAALKVGSDISAKIEMLADFPEMGVPLSGKINIKTDYRFLTCGVYLIFYKVEGEYVSIYRVLNGVRDYLSIIFNNEEGRKVK